jgi:hypothetical protein
MIHSIYELVLHVILVALFGYGLLLGFSLTKRLYGGKFTSVLPPLIASLALLLFIQILEFSFGYLTPYAETMEFVFGVQMLQILAGVFLINALYRLYQINFATSGFFGGK